jgi:hypothetical protein
MAHRGPSTFRVTDPPESRISSRPVSNCLAAVSRRRYDNGFLGANGNPVGANGNPVVAGGTAVTSGPSVLVTVMPDSVDRPRRRSHE